jgi:hypothetical protein
MYTSNSGSTGGKKCTCFFSKNKYAISVGATRSIPTNAVYSTQNGVPSRVIGLVPTSGTGAVEGAVCGWATITWYVRFIGLQSAPA